MIDTHAHLADNRLDAGQIIANMAVNGLKKIICASFDLESSINAVNLANEYRNVFASVGIHPNDADKASDDVLNQIFELSKNKKVVAFGEIGLDYYHKFVEKGMQNEVLIKQLDLISQTNLPIIFHLRDAYLDMQNIINMHKHKIKNGAVMHCFSGSSETAKFYTDLGFYISFGGAVTFKNAKYDEIIKSIPLDKLLVETDCPYLSPEPFRGKINQPKNVRFVIEKIANVLRMEFEKIEEITTHNAQKLFKI
ncbi:MAG: TatD family hydrolase [Firmicutes bacterium]|nr:TatD family hydrolase [Bacillota bacterium]